MSPLNFTHILTQAVDELSESESYKGLFHQHKDGEPLPSAKVLYEIIELSRSILFPGYYGNSTINSRTINYHIGVNVCKAPGVDPEHNVVKLAVFERHHHSGHVGIGFLGNFSLKCGAVASSIAHDSHKGKAMEKIKRTNK